MTRGCPDRLARALAVTLGGLAMALAACGGGGAAKPSSNAITRPQYVAKVDAVCKQVARASKPTFRKLQALVDASGTYKSRLIKAAPLLRTTYEAQLAKLEKIQKIEAPTADRAQVAEVVKAAEATLKELRDFLPAAASGDLDKFIDIATDASGARAQVELLGTRLGLRTDCFSIPVKLG